MSRARRTARTRKLTTAVGSIVIAAIVVTISGCSRSYDTTQVDAVDQKRKSSASTTTIVVETVPTTTTTIDFEAVKAARPPSVDLQSTLSELVSGFAIDPTLIAQIQTLASGDLQGVAEMFGIDLSSLDQLGMTVKQIEGLGESVLKNIDLVQQELLGAAGAAVGSVGALGGAALDPAVLIGVLTSSVDIGDITQGAIAAIVQTLADSISKTEIRISPEITIYLNELLKEIDPSGLGQITADPWNASFMALLTSVVLSANPLLTEQLLDNPLLDPKLKDLLSDLGDLNASRGQTASAAIIAALKQLFPGLAL